VDYDIHGVAIAFAQGSIVLVPPGTPIPEPAVTRMLGGSLPLLAWMSRRRRADRESRDPAV
jgi:hypothetical protein